MSLYQQREQDLKEHIENNLKLQKKLEDQLRLEGDEKEKAKLKKDIKENKESTTAYQVELNTIGEGNREALAREMSSVTFDELGYATHLY